MRTRTRRAAATVSGAVIAAVLLAGCSDTDAEAEPAPSTTSEASAPTTTASADLPEVPAMPAEAEGTDDAAAVAFVEYWVELVNYAFTSGDTAPALALAPECELCQEALTEVSPDPSDPGWALSNSESVSVESTDPPGTTAVVVGDVVTTSRDGVLTTGLQSTPEGWRVLWLGAF